MTMPLWIYELELPSSDEAEIIRTIKFRGVYTLNGEKVKITERLSREPEMEYDNEEQDRAYMINGNLYDSEPSDVERMRHDCSDEVRRRGLRNQDGTILTMKFHNA